MKESEQWSLKMSDYILSLKPVNVLLFKRKKVLIDVIEMMQPTALSFKRKAKIAYTPTHRYWSQIEDVQS